MSGITGDGALLIRIKPYPVRRRVLEKDFIYFINIYVLIHL